MIEPTPFDIIGYVVVELARPGQRFLVARRQRLAGIKIAHRRRQPGSRQGIRIAPHERIDAENRRHDQHTAFGRLLRSRQIAVEAVAGDVLRLDRHCFTLAVAYSAATRLPIAAFTAGMTFSAIRSMDRRDSAGSAQSLPQYSNVPKSPIFSCSAKMPSTTRLTLPRMTTLSKM